MYVEHNFYKHMYLRINNIKHNLLFVNFNYIRINIARHTFITPIVLLTLLFLIQIPIN